MYLVGYLYEGNYVLFLLKVEVSGVFVTLVTTYQTTYCYIQEIFNFLRNLRFHLTLCNYSFCLYVQYTSAFNVFFFEVKRPLVCQVLLIVVALLSHSDISHWVGLFWTSDQPFA